MAKTGGDYLGRASRWVQRHADRAGIYFFATREVVAIGRKSPQFQPELANRALWRPFVIDDKWRAVYNSSIKTTQPELNDPISKQCRFYSTFQFAEHTAASLPEGDVVECGCWHGQSAVAIATLLQEHGFTGQFHVFDSFEGGLSDFTPEDDGFFNLTEDQKQEYLKAFASSYHAVRSVTAPFGFVDLHKGWIPDVFAGFEPRPIRFVHVDVDMFDPTKAALEFFWPQLVKGGVIVCDDYYSLFDGATKAVDEFLTGVEPSLVYRVPFGSIAIIK
ncbi:MAG: O-methyltransferase [Mycobacterium sp.]|nr:O-methyltransferase [Mycobacterium sp.]